MGFFGLLSLNIFELKLLLALNLFAKSLMRPLCKEVHFFLSDEILKGIKDAINPSKFIRGYTYKRE